ncbi:hypothetical protein Ddye_016108 [Dipteronia dyeriana]|uniref:cytokinin riboside 5'-monophosphate phosphoribohydrolase n=1 Tax=Dipteronia dyeriana TaxID=168575 RepID=A0AAD9U725_9ROSI|nr:hypothetical protein Ddye_016108 [Dipteronia dyeriana]
MGYVSRAARDRGSQVLGFVPKPMAAANNIGKTNGEELVVSGMQERLTAMLHHADAFIALPGGFGNIEEIFTMASWVQLHIHEKPIKC